MSTSPQNPPLPRKALSHTDLFHGGNARSQFTVGEFWQWAFSGLQENILRGVLAEFLVGKALGCNLLTRRSWDDFDLVTPSGITVEVKSSSYLQSWAQKKRSALVFGGLRSRKWTPEAGYAEIETYGADVYIFCVQKAETHETYDPLDLDQWEFRVVHRTRLEELGARSMSIATLQRIAPDTIPFSNLQSAVERVGAAGG